MWTQAKICCPFCRFEKAEEMAVGFPERQYTCSACGKKLEVAEAECCVYCKFSDAICPEQQEKRNCCSG